MTRPRARFLHRDNTDYIFALADDGASWRFVRVPVAEFWRAP